MYVFLTVCHAQVYAHSHIIVVTMTCLYVQVLLSAAGGSNRGGYTILRSNMRTSVRFDGVFNIVSYDAIPKFQNILMSTEFKVISTLSSAIYFCLFFVSFFSRC